MLRGKTGFGKYGKSWIRKKISSFEIPPYRGDWYEAMIPDTLDLAERAELAINGLTAPTDPEDDYEIYFFADFFSNPPIMEHSWADWVQAKFMEALPLLRIATGSDLNSHVDRAWMEVILKSIGPDGLFYISTEGRPWTTYIIYFPMATPVWRADGTSVELGDKSITQYTCPMICGRIIGAMTIYYLRDKNPIWKETIEQMIQRLSQLVIDKDDYCFFPASAYEPNAKISLDAEIPKDYMSVETSGGRLIQGLAQYYKVTGYEPARKLAEKLVKCLRYHGEFYDAEGHFKGLKHFHAHTIGLLSMLDYALAVGDQELIEYVKKSYEWAKTQGSSLVGFFPELTVPYYPSSEICEVADMISLALKLTEAGLGDYWDDVDRWVRNQFAENQLTKVDWVDRISRTTVKHLPHFNETDDRVAERNLGAFAGWSSGSDWAINMGIMHCCTGNAARALYYVWERILDYENGRLRINLLLNRASPWVDVDSYIPYEGRIDLKMKKPCASVTVRVPEWIENGDKKVNCTVNNKARELKWEDRYVNVGEAKSGDTVTITFPIQERTAKEFIGDRLYTLVIKGNTVVFIDPPGKNCPLYQRIHYRENKTRWRKIRRFVSEEYIKW